MTKTIHHEFEGWPKIPRFHKDVVLTEKLDGTNAHVRITRYSRDEYVEIGDHLPAHCIVKNEMGGVVVVEIGSRNRWLTADADNHGFHRHVKDNLETFIELGTGHHFGEWWGLGIGRGYDLKEKRFSLFNTRRWGEHNPPPKGLYVVPVLAVMKDGAGNINQVIESLKMSGSFAAPGYMKPEGIVAYFAAADQMFKILCENDDKHKGELANG